MLDNATGFHIQSTEPDKILPEIEEGIQWYKNLLDHWVIETKKHFHSTQLDARMYLLCCRSLFSLMTKRFLLRLRLFLGM